MAQTPAPKHLSTRTRAIWSAVVKDYALDAVGLELLQRACEAADRCDQAREILDREGLLVEGRFAPQPHPCVQLERDSRIAELRAWAQLGLDPDEPRADGRRR